MHSQQLEYEVSFSEKPIIHTKHILKLFFIQMPVSPKVFVLEKRDCTFWKWQNLSFKMAYVTYTLDKNYGSYRQKRINFSLPTVHFGL